MNSSISAFALEARASPDRSPVERRRRRSAPSRRRPRAAVTPDELPRARRVVAERDRGTRRRRRRGRCPFGREADEGEVGPVARLLDLDRGASRLCPPFVGELHQRVLVVQPVARRRTSRAPACRGAPAPVGAPFAISRLGNELVRAPAIPSNEIDRTPSKMPTSVTFAMVRGLLEGDAAVGRSGPVWNTACF